MYKLAPCEVAGGAAALLCWPSSCLSIMLGIVTELWMLLKQCPLRAKPCSLSMTFKFDVTALCCLMRFTTGAAPLSP